MFDIGVAKGEGGRARTENCGAKFRAVSCRPKGTPGRASSHF